ncbi:MAG: hypothetical protein HQ583_09080, partial [Candidatus Abyssubacteria bacterium]|nr:hypothetical protein [Candidatus Abyssubacteria bacterium]
MQRNNYLYFTLLVLFLVAASIAFSYSPMIFDPNYQGEDFIFLSQASQIGYVKSFLLSYKDHFIPLYRILWGALHLLFKNAISIRAVILGFHIINAALIFHIVRRHTKSVALATIASVTFGFSQKVASGVVWCINGVWGISLCFILLMSICLERFLRNNEYAGSPADENCGNPSNAISDSSSVASPSGTHPGNFRYYYAALVSFAVALGFFTISISGGTVIWLFMYARVLRAKKFRQNLGYHLKIIIPFLVILAVYLPIRSHF